MTRNVQTDDGLEYHALRGSGNALYTDHSAADAQLRGKLIFTEGEETLFHVKFTSVIGEDRYTTHLILNAQHDVIVWASKPNDKDGWQTVLAALRRKGYLFN